jgi:hypothetical protein
MNNPDATPDADRTADLSANRPPPDATVDHAPSTAGTPRGPVRRPLPTVPGYEIRGELGRGGMGVVYLARHAALNRDVALKLIRGGPDADPTQLDRFRVEAEAVAHLHHPNVVQIFEVGEFDGVPFCALEYLPGGSLSAALKARAFGPAEAAGLVEPLARAAHHAHQKGIVHRDLKPANVLLAEDGTPKLTDFGLAKRLDEVDSHLTQSGAVMGTPAYMAPEQAAGRTREIGPPADIYALGGVLYELLAGRPAFQADTVVALLKAVETADPAPPSAVAPGVPRDLETICLTCLAKDPARRYSSALALAQDLERFRAGEPILARREGLVRKVWRKARKRVAVIAAVCLAVVAAGVAVRASLQAGSSRELAGLSREFDAALDAGGWQPDEFDARITRLAALDATAADSARRKVVDRTAKRVRDGLGRPRVTAADAPTLERDIEWVAARDADLARELDHELRRRLRTWQPLFDLAPPFENRDAVFATAAVTPAGVVRPAGADEVVLARVPTFGPVRVTAEFAPAWFAAERLGVFVDAADDARGGTGYEFVLTAARGDDGDGGPTPKSARPTFRDTQGAGTLDVLRGGVLIRRAEVRLLPGPLKVVVARDGEVVRVSVNDRPESEVIDLSPLAVPRGRVGLRWPAGVPVAAVRVETTPLPPAPSQLEQADDLLARSRHAEALPLYERNAAPAGPVGPEATCKAGLCLIGLDRLDEAAARFEPLLASPGGRWTAVAAVHLWLVRLRQKQFAQADEVFATVQARFSRDELARLVPEGVRAELAGVQRLPALAYLSPTRDAVREFEARLRTSELLDPTASRFRLMHYLGITQALVGDAVGAGNTFRAMFEANDYTDPRTTAQLTFSARWYYWASRRDGQTAFLLPDLDRLLARGNVLFAPAAAANFRAAVNAVKLLLARRHIVYGELGPAEALVDSLLADPEFLVQSAYFATFEIWMLKHHLRARRGDTAGAAAALRNATPRAWQTRPGADKYYTQSISGRYDLVAALIAGAGDGGMTDAEARDLLQQLGGIAGDDPMFSQVMAVVNLSPAVLRGAFQSPRGRRLAQQMVLLEIAPVDYFRTPPRLLVYEKLRQDLFGGKPAGPEDDLVWETVVSLGNAILDGAVGKSLIIPLGLAWKGTAGPLGWGAVAKGLPPAHLAPLSYLMGKRFVQLKQPNDAAGMFRAAAAGAGKDERLARLAQQELDRLGKK